MGIRLPGGVGVHVLVLAVGNVSHFWTTFYLQRQALYIVVGVTLVWRCELHDLYNRPGMNVIHIFNRSSPPDEIYFFRADKNTQESLQRMTRLLSSEVNPKAEVRWWKSLTGTLADLTVCLLRFSLPCRLILRCLWTVDTCQNIFC